LVHQPFVPGDGPGETDFAVVGQAPGDQEVALGRPFVGPAGTTLRRELAELRVQDSKLHFTNSVLCHPGKNERTGRDRKPPAAAINACHERLTREIKETGATWILAVGEVAAAGFDDEWTHFSARRCSVLGSPIRPIRLDGEACVGITHHPSASLPRALLVADIRTLLSFRCDDRTPNVY
jgi:uracil-DNA glycosylase family 4